MKYPVKYDAQEVQQAIEQVYANLPSLTPDTIFLVLLNGGVWFAQELLRRYENEPLVVYYIKVSSYHGKEQGTLRKDYLPEIDFKGKNVIVLDDICDTGNTINAIYHYVLDAGAASVSFATLIARTGYALEAGVELVTGIVDDSKDFFVGCGLDDNDEARNLPYIGIC